MNVQNLERKWIWALVVGVALALAWRPFVLGFYYDDWFHLIVPDLTSAPFSVERWDQLEVTQNRPVFRLLAVVLHSILPTNPVIWHIWIVALMLATALSLGLASQAVLRRVFDEDVALKGALVGGLFWLAFPWAVPNAFWPTATTAFFALSALALSIWLVVDHWDDERLAPKVWVFGLSLVGYLCYEAIYFQLMMVLAFCMLAYGWQKRPALAWAAAVIVPQFLAFGVNRYMRSVGAEGSRKFNTNFVETFYYWFGLAERKLGLAWLNWTVVAGVIFLAVLIVLAVLARKRLGEKPLKTIALLLAWSFVIMSTAAVCLTLPMSFLETALVFVPLFVVMAGFSLWAWYGLSETQKTGVLWVLWLALSGACLAALAFAAGNFVMWSTGMGGRVTVIVSLWLTLFAGLAYGVMAHSQLNAKWSTVLGVSLWGALLVATLFRGAEWHRSWDMQQDILANVPKFDYEAADPKAAYLYSGPEQYGWVPVIETNWHMGAFATAAFWDQAQTDGQKAFAQDWTHRWMISRVQRYRLTWDGQVLKRYLCTNLGGAPHDFIEAPELWLWDGWKHTLKKADPGLSLGCG